MRIVTLFVRMCLLALFAHSSLSSAQDYVNLRVMAANLNGDVQSYQPFALRIFEGLKPDVAAIQEFDYGGNAPSDFRAMLDTAFGTNFVYYREPYTSSGDIPNGIISRYPIINSGSWADAQQSQPNRGFAWAEIQLPGTNVLYVVSVHLLTSSASARAAEATALQGLMQSSFPSNARVVLAGDFNTDSRTESCMATFDSFLSDFPVPVDNNGNSDTSENRNHPHDYVLPSFAFTNLETATVLPSHSFPSGLVFDSTVYTPLSDVTPVLFGDSTNAQHMAVMKDFSVPAGPTTNPPAISVQPQGQTNAVGAMISFSVAATGGGTLNYQWLFNGTNISGAIAKPLVIAAAQVTNDGNYSVVITNLYGSITSSPAALLLTNAPAYIIVPPQSQTVNLGDTATFNVTAGGTPPLSYQWLFGGTNLSGANASQLFITAVQLTNAGSYSVLVSNFVGSVTSSPAQLSVFSTLAIVMAQWNCNSVPPDGNTATGTSSPSFGSGTASLIGGATATFATGDTSFDPVGSTDNSGWNTASYPTQGTGNKTRGAQFNVSTAGRQNIVIVWSSESPSTGSRYGRLQYSTNGTDFLDYPTSFINGTSYTTKTNSLSFVPTVNNDANFACRFMAEFESTATGSANANYDAGDTAKNYGTAGSMRYDMVTVFGASTAPPAAAVLDQPQAGGNQFSFEVAGSSGASYVVQSATDLNSTNWLPVATNVSPFSFSDTNFSATQKFYRAVSQ